MISPREEVLEDVLQRIAEERGVETMALDWAILNELVEETNQSKFNRRCVSKPHGLRKRLDGVGLAQDKSGFYVRTHRARSKSYKDPAKIPQKDIRFIRSTG